MRGWSVGVAGALALSGVLVACGGDCPAGFLKDNEGNCLEQGADDATDGKTGNDNNGNNTNNASNTNNTNNSTGSTDDGTATLYVINDSGWDVTDLYVSACNASSWGADQMSGTTGPGDTYSVSGIPEGCYDLQAWSWNGAAVWESFGVQMSGGFDWTLRD
jgi:hypothetical protein